MIILVGRKRDLLMICLEIDDDDDDDDDDCKQRANDRINIQ